MDAPQGLHLGGTRPRPAAIAGFARRRELRIDRLGQRVRSIVYLDAFVPEDGLGFTDFAPGEGVALRAVARVMA